MFYEDVFKLLNKNKVNYLVIGGLAVNFYGYPRTTLDLDLLISLDQENRAKFYSIMEKLKFKTMKPDLAKKLMLEKYTVKSIKVVTFFRHEFELIDVFIQNPVNFKKAYERKKLFKSGKIPIPTIPYDLLIRMKNKSGRERDLVDIGYLRKTRGNNAKKG
ncbi:MAG: hypothetical protein FD145_957 [Candidatus Saganbacteria bacterium]|uniref:Nucleotidyltransferase family protein n=1 Tax=Candidatus Saganbacteria bacterium TaxID=2575572 RepID=A0A833NZU6_UNCSA|nr:MAG: hypothetical protein FD145_957 [Candidatus Saganbacteria bacterium]